MDVEDAKCTYWAFLSDRKSCTELREPDKRARAHFNDCFIEHLSDMLTGAEKRYRRAYLDYLQVCEYTRDGITNDVHTWPTQSLYTT